MKTKRPRQITVLFSSSIALLLATWVAVGQQTGRIDDAALKNTGKTGEEWLAYGLTPGETRYSPLKQIDRNNSVVVSVPRSPGLYQSAKLEPDNPKRLPSFGRAIMPCAS